MVPFNRAIRTLMMCSPLALAACATGRDVPPVVAPPIATAEPEAGIYKVGKPYQVEGVWYYPAEDYAYVQEGIASWYGADFQGKRTANGDRYNMDDLTAAHPTLPMPSVVKVTNLENGYVLKVTVNDRGPYHSTRIIDVSRRAAQLLGFYESGTARVRVEIDPEESMTLKNIALSKYPPEMPQIKASPRGSVSSLALAPLAGTNDSVPVPPGTVKSVAVPAPPKLAQPKSQPSKTVPAKPAPAKATPAKLPPTPNVAPPGGSRAAGAAALGIFIQAGAFSEEANARKLEQQLGELGPVRIVPSTVNKKKLYRVRLGPVADAAAATALLGKVKAYGYNDAKVVRE